MFDIPSPLALGEWVVHNVRQVIDQDEVSIVLITKETAVNVVLLSYLCKCYDAVRCNVIMNDKQRSPNLELLQSAGGARCALEIRCSFVSDRTNFDFAQQIKNTLQEPADIVIYSSKDIQSTDLDELVQGVDSILSPSGIFINERIVRNPINNVDDLNHPHPSSPEQLVLSSWIELPEAEHIPVTLDKASSITEVLKFYLSLRRESQQTRAHFSSTEKEQSSIADQSATLIKVTSYLDVRTNGSESVLSTRRDLTWKHAGYISEGMRQRLQDNSWWPKGEFRNPGLVAWKRGREEWLSYDGPEITGNPTRDISYMVIAQNMFQGKPFDLPERLRLGELIGVLVDVWDSQHGR